MILVLRIPKFKKVTLEMNQLLKIFFFSLFLYTVQTLDTVNLYSQLVPDFKVNDDSTTYSHLAAKIGADSSGNFVIVWQDERNSVPDSTKVDAFCQQYNFNGMPVGNNFRINDRVGLSANPDITVRSNGWFIVCWKEFYLRPLLNIRMYDNTGMPKTLPITVNDSDGAIYSPSLCSDSFGNFVIAWESSTTLYGDRVFFQRFNEKGSKVGRNQNVSDNGVNSRKRNPDITVRRDGSFIICWHDNRLDPGTYDVFMQMYNSNGERIGNNRRVNQFTNDHQYYPKISSDSAGNFCIIWSDEPILFPVSFAMCQFYDAMGIESGSNILIANNTVATVVNKRLNGDLAVGMYSGSRPVAQRMRSDRTFIGNQFFVSNQALSSWKLLTDLEIHKDKIITVWQDNRNGHFDIYCNVRSFKNPDSVLSIIQTSNEMPLDFKIFQNYPNPFNSVTKIPLHVSTTGIVAIKIYDLLGKEITTLLNLKLSAGKYDIEFDATNLPSGIYFYSAKFGNHMSETKKLILIK